MDKRGPSVSVVMSVYNGGEYLQQAIDSILEQTFENFEFIIVNDGSTDQSEVIIQSYIDPRIIYIKNDKNIGLAASLNKGINKAKSEYIARMDSDDISHRERLEVQLKYLKKHPEVVILGSAARFIDEVGQGVCQYLPAENDSKLRLVFPGSPFIHPSVVFKRDIFLLAGQYPEIMRWGGEDPVLFANMAKFGFLHNIQKSLIDYRLVSSSMSRKPKRFRRLLAELIEAHISGADIDNQTYEEIDGESKRFDKSKSLANYYLEIAKLYLWSGADRIVIWRNLTKSLKSRASLVKILTLFLMSLFPKQLLQKLYFKFKKRTFISFK